MPKPLEPTRADRLRKRSAERRESERTRLRDELFSVAERLLSVHGYAGFSLRQVAEETGYTPTTVYRYFRDRDDLLAAILERWFGHFANALAVADATATDPTGRLLAQARAYLRFATENPAVYRMMFLERMDMGILPGANDYVDDPAFGVLMRAVTALHAEGRTGSHGVMESALTLWASIHGVAAMAVCSDILAHVGPEQLGMVVAVATLEGLRAT